MRLNSKNIFGHKIYMDSRPPAHVPALPNYFSFQVKCLKPNFARLKSQNILYDTLFHDHHRWCTIIIFMTMNDAKCAQL